MAKETKITQANKVNNITVTKGKIKGHAVTMVTFAIDNQKIDCVLKGFFDEKVVDIVPSYLRNLAEERKENFKRKGINLIIMGDIVRKDKLLRKKMIESFQMDVANSFNTEAIVMPQKDDLEKAIAARFAKLTDAPVERYMNKASGILYQFKEDKTVISFVYGKETINSNIKGKVDEIFIPVEAEELRSLLTQRLEFATRMVNYLKSNNSDKVNQMKQVRDMIVKINGNIMNLLESAIYDAYKGNVEFLPREKDEMKVLLDQMIEEAEKNEGDEP